MPTRRTDLPKYLFRGECGSHPKTVPACDRLEDLGLDPRDRVQLLQLTLAIVKYLASPESNFKLVEYQAGGLVQHLGLPTDYIDFSESPDVAIAFAVCSSEKACGQVCVLDVPDATRANQVAEFCHHDWCERARRQAAYGYGPIEFRDLKSPEAIEQAGARWFKSPVRGQDRDRFRDRYKELLDTGTDPVAGLLRWQVNDYVAEKGKLRDRVAWYCVEKIPMVPLVAQVRSLRPTGEPDVVNFLPPRDRTDWDEIKERDCSLRYWSQGYPDAILRPDYFLGGQIDARGIFVFPATHHPSGSR
jgi:hypothetical protein